MACLGVLFSLSEQEVLKLKSLSNDQDRLEYLQEEIEEEYFNEHENRIAELDKSWDALHRSLTDGTLAYNNVQFPLSHVILGGEILYSSGDYIMTLKTSEEVKHIASYLENVDIAFLQAGYEKISEQDYGFPKTLEDFEYTWSWFDDSKEFWKLAAQESRYVLFTADQ